ncbi:unnamed protein product [Musa acuminata subsp. burmannicoides]
MELPDVGDLCLVVIQKWMNHITSACHSLRCLNWAKAVESYSELWASIVGCYVIVV